MNTENNYQKGDLESRAFLSEYIEKINIMLS